MALLRGEPISHEPETDHNRIRKCEWERGEQIKVRLIVGCPYVFVSDSGCRSAKNVIKESRGCEVQIEKAIEWLRQTPEVPARISNRARAGIDAVSENNNLAASRMDAEAAECRWLAAKFKQRAADAKLPAKKALFLRLERRYTLMAEINQKEAERLRARGRRWSVLINPGRSGANAVNRCCVFVRQTDDRSPEELQ